MIEVLRQDWPTLSAVRPDERPGALVPAHALVTGLGRIWVDDPAAHRMLAASGLGHAAWENDRVISLAASFYAGRRFEELGVVTEHDYRGRGLSPVCAAALIEDARERGRVPCWSTTPDNQASLRVAHKLGFRHLHDALHLGAGARLSGSRPLA